MSTELQERLAHKPLIAILRGLPPERALAVGEVLVTAGFGILEVPLNSPSPFDSIASLVKALGQRALIGAGTVMDAIEVESVYQAGGRLIVMPHFDEYVVTSARLRSMACAPGVATPSEGFAALRAGADGLKLFPAELLTPNVIKAWRAVFPASTALLPVGGITTENMAAYWQAGASGFGLGSALFKPDMELAEIKSRAEGFVVEIERLRQQC